ncbi:MAG: FAD-binding oxidoreductase, partial [Nevskiales bacterium]
MPQPVVLSWGRYPRVTQRIDELYSRHDRLPVGSESLLPYGNGRSYGDSCLNPGGVLLHTRGLDRFIAFDETTGRVCCESGVLLSEVLDLVVPRGWFLPVTPGTRFVTVGGAIANDVHGKNHHRAGTFGCHVLQFELLRSDGTHLFCSTGNNAEWFAATVGGLGLTGLILWAEIQLRRIDSTWINGETLRFGTLGEFFNLSAKSDTGHEYTVAWIDCGPQRRISGRGLFSRGNHAPAREAGMAITT